MTKVERAKISVVERAYAVEDQLEEYLLSGSGLSWESFCVYESDDRTEPTVIFEGATKLPDNTEDAMWVGIQHWCSALTAIRRVLPDAKWEVHVDDHPIQWDDDSNAFDPTR